MALAMVDGGPALPVYAFNDQDGLLAVSDATDGSFDHAYPFTGRENHSVAAVDIAPDGAIYIAGTINGSATFLPDLT